MTLQHAIHAPSKKLILPYDARLAALIPTAQTATRRGVQLLLLPHTGEVTKFLNNLGAGIPHPIRHHYKWSGTAPYTHQKETAEMLVSNRRAYNLDEQGTGKTLSTLWALDYLHSAGVVRTAVVSAPLSTLTPVWSREIVSYFPHLSYVVVHGTAQQRRKLMQTPADVYIVNHHGVGIVLDELLGKNPDLLIIDELAVLRTKRTKLWKTHNALSQRCSWVWGLTGEPMPNAPTDVYGQVKLVTPTGLNTSFTAFRSRTMYQVSVYQWIEKEDAIQTVHEAMSPAVRHKRDECLDLPPMTISTREADLSPAQARAYSEMTREYATEVASGEITAANGGVKLSKLLQISSGAVYMDNGAVTLFDNIPRDKVLREVIDETHNKVLVFATYKSVVDKVHEELSKHYTTEKVYSSTPKNERDRIFSDFQNMQAPRVIVAHPRTMAHGVTLTKADTVIWYNPPSSEMWGQANARVTRTGQIHKQRVICLVSNAAERTAFRRIQSKQSLQGTLLELFEGNEYA